MTTDLKDPPEHTTASLVSGILGDLHHLVEQQFQLTRREIEDEMRRRVTATAVFGAGAGILSLAAIVLCLAVAHVLHWMASPPGSDAAWLPLWICHVIVATGLILIGGIVMENGRARFRSINPAQNPAREILQEKVR